MLIQENVPLAPFTTFQVGGPARYFLEAASIQELEKGVHFARSQSLPLFVLGGGSNLVVSDNGWPGLVLRIAILGIDQTSDAAFEVGAGEDWDHFVAHSVERDCAGIECLSGIPGSVGGTPVQNVGAYGQEVSTTIESVLTLDLKDGQLHELCNEACGFGYRTSIFNTTQHGRYIILRVTYSLIPRGAPSLKYADLQKAFAGQTTPTLAQTREAILKIRAGKGMLISPDDPDSRSAGSFFKNPILPQEQLETLMSKANANGPRVPCYPAPDGQHKVSAAWLVEHSGFHKGHTSGAVGISTKHSLALVNRGGAKARDIIVLKERIQHQVQDSWGIWLEPEPVFVGF